jgi:hypothetical protein
MALNVQRQTNRFGVELMLSFFLPKEREDRTEVGRWTMTMMDGDRNGRI